MYADPPLKSPGEIYEFAPQLMSLWIEALERPEADLQRQAADAIAEAHRLGMPGLHETATNLMKLVEATETNAIVRLSAARALIALDAKQAAAAFETQLAAGSLEFSMIVEPALARWKPDSIRKTWLSRLADAGSPRGLTLVAIRGLRGTELEQVPPQLRDLAVNPSADPSLRLEAARSLGLATSAGLEDDARRLASAKSTRGVVDKLAAAAMLAKHTSDVALAILSDLAVDPEPAVASASLQVLRDQKSTLAVPIAEKSLTHPDARVREVAAGILADNPTAERLKLLGERLDDVSSTVREGVRIALERNAGDDTFKDAVREIATAALTKESWRAQEQGARLAGALDIEPAADRLVVLLDSPRPEVFVTAAWALRRISVESSAAGIMLKLVREGEQIAGQLAGKAAPKPGDPNIDPAIVREGKDRQFSQLFQTLGQLKHGPAAAGMRVCIRPSGAVGHETRAAAIWGLGILETGKSDSQFAKEFAARLNDVDGNRPEDNRIRRMSAIGLGRMKSKDGLNELRRFEKEPTIVGAACVWALREITGENIPEPKPHRLRRTGWFLEPLEPPAAEQADQSAVGTSSTAD